MRKLALPLTIGAAMAAICTLISPAQAVLNHSWVASNGADSATCGDRPTPCATFQRAHDNTNSGGEVTCVDSGNYGALAISKGITINCENAIGSTTPAGGSGGGNITINAFPSEVVVLRGLDLDGRNTGVSSCGTTCGMISFISGAVLHVDKVKINGLGNFGIGIQFVPNGAARLDVSDSFIADNGSNLSTAGILIKPQSGGNANVSVSRTDLKGNVNGIFVDGSGGGGVVNLNVRDSLVTGSSNSGIVVYTNGPSVTALIDRTTVNYSSNTGVAVAGAAATVRIGNSTISNNVTGVIALSGGSLRSYKNNQINANTTDGTPIAAEGLN